MEKMRDRDPVRERERVIKNTNDVPAAHASVPRCGHTKAVVSIHRGATDTSSLSFCAKRMRMCYHTGDMYWPAYAEY